MKKFMTVTYSFSTEQEFNDFFNSNKRPRGKDAHLGMRVFIESAGSFFRVDSTGSLVTEGGSSTMVYASHIVDIPGVYGLVDGDSLEIGRTYINDTKNAIGDFSNVGGPVFDGTGGAGGTFVATGTTPLDWGNIILHSDPAVVTNILENTLGNVVWAISNLGEYLGTLPGAFVFNKTYLSADNGFGSMKYTLTTAMGVDVGFYTLHKELGNEDYIILRSYDVNGLPADLYTLTSDSNIVIEIKVAK